MPGWRTDAARGGGAAMIIVLLGHEDIASLFAMSLLVTSRPEHDYRVFLSGPLAPVSVPPLLAELARADRALCGALAAAGRIAPPVRAAAELRAPNSPAGLAMLSAARPDLIASIRYRRILRDAAIAMPQHGVLNLHSGILPDYPGVMATFWALLAGDAEIGCTLHRIVDAGIDTGPVVEVLRRPSEPKASYLANLLGLYPAGVARFCAAIDCIARGDALPVRPQPPGGGRYYATPDAVALARFLAAGLRLVDDSESERLAKLVGPGNIAEAT